MIQPLRFEVPPTGWEDPVHTAIMLGGGLNASNPFIPGMLQRIAGNYWDVTWLGSADHPALQAIIPGALRAKDGQWRGIDIPPATAASLLTHQAGVDTAGMNHWGDRILLAFYNHFLPKGTTPEGQSLEKEYVLEPDSPWRDKLGGGTHRDLTSGDVSYQILTKATLDAFVQKAVIPALNKDSYLGYVPGLHAGLELVGLRVMRELVDNAPATFELLRNFRDERRVLSAGQQWGGQGAEMVLL